MIGDQIGSKTKKLVVIFFEKNSLALKLKNMEDGGEDRTVIARLSAELVGPNGRPSPLF